MDRVILHCDLNNFYASVSTMDRPDLKGKPVAVCGDPETRHGIILAKNYEAKGYGVTTASPVWEALQKCPDLVLLPPSFDKYMHYSKKVQEIYLSYTDQVEPFGIDECWLDVTGSQKLFGSGVEIAKQIINRVLKECGLTISVGISFCKSFAKVGSDQVGRCEYYEISRDDFKQKLYDKEVGILLGIGKSAQKTLEKIGVRTVGDLAACNDMLLRRKFGKVAAGMQAMARGEENAPVKINDEIEEVKSVGNSVTLAHNVYSFDEMWPVFLQLAEKCSGRMRALGVMARGIAISVKDAELETKQLQMPLPFATYSSEDIARFAFNMALERYKLSKPVRAIGVRGYDLIPAEAPTQLSLFEDDTTVRKREKLDLVRDDLTERFGKNVVTRAGLMQVSSIPPKHKGADELQVFGKKMPNKNKR